MIAITMRARSLGVVQSPAAAEFGMQPETSGIECAVGSVGEGDVRSRVWAVGAW